VLLLDGSFVFSASDLSGYLACDHLLTLDRDAATGVLAKTRGPGALSARYGDEHEAAYLARLKSAGVRVAELERPPSLSRTALEEAQRATVAALAGGYDVVYQGTLFDGTWLGHPDFLVRGGPAGGAWPHTYDVVDTKLARRAKATALVQVALYAQLLTPLQGVEPRWLILALGDGSEERFAYTAVSSYLRAVQARFTDALSAPAPYPYPVEHCALCPWEGHCDDRRRRDDHLSLVAGIRRQQVERLEAAGVPTVAALAALPSLTGVPIGRGVADRLGRQAREQVRSREEGRVSYSRLPSVPGDGLDLLPPPDDGDVFFDLEGFPYAEDGGLEYLFGWVDLSGTFHHRFAADRAAERRAFEQFMDDLAERRRRHPGLHVYHYASYERTALSRLSNRHGVREEEVADLLRDEVLVDLYRVVRRSVVVGAPSYSIKQLEPLYGLRRTGDVQTATESLEMYQDWLDSNPRDDTIRDRIVAYNEVDCRSTLALRDWLLALRGEPPGAVETDVDADVEGGGARSTTMPDWLASVDATSARLLDGLPEDPSAWDHEQRGRRLLAHLLKFHQREDNAGWREYFARMELSWDELRDDDRVAIGDLRFERLGDRVRRSQEHVYSFPSQDVGLRLGDRPIDPATGSSPGELVRLDPTSATDPTRGELVLRRGTAATAPHPRALVPKELVGTYVLRESLLRLADWVADHGLDSPEPPWRAARQLLLRQPPRLAGIGPDQVAPGEHHRPLTAIGEHGADAIVRLVPRLDGAALPVQGPPGSGKTYSAAQVIVDAVGRGRRVGVTANSHRVIEHLLVAVRREAARRGTAVRLVHKTDVDDDPVDGVRNVGDNKEVVDLLDRGGMDVLGGTAWLMARPAMAGRLDLLVVDEAGQVSLANALASMGVAIDTLLVGDPAQLDQPFQGAHPEGTDVSALAHVIDGAATMPDDLGLFLDCTRRMHPSICRFVSDVVYDGKLSSVDGLERQRVDGRVDQRSRPGRERLAGAGIRWLAVPHHGNRAASVEEAERIAAAVDELVGGAWVDAAGDEHVLGPEHILVVTPYNAQIVELAARLPAGVEIGTVDRFQGREAPVVFYSMATSSLDDLPRDVEFLFSLHRLNVAVSRAQALAVLVCSPALRAPRCRTTRQVQLLNALCRLIEDAEASP
jgi:predicted RecB family nuclease